MRQIALFLLAAALNCGSAVALTAPHLLPTRDRWWCTLNGIMAGNPNHFLLYGRDAWEGDAVMSCRGPRVQQSLSVRVGFYSKLTGVGANATSVLKYTVTLWTTVAPANLKFFATIPGMSDGSSVHWQVIGQETELTGTAWPSSINVLGDSLTLGTLNIQPQTSQVNL